MSKIKIKDEVEKWDDKSRWRTISLSVKNDHLFRVVIHMTTWRDYKKLHTRTIYDCSICGDEHIFGAFIDSYTGEFDSTFDCNETELEYQICFCGKCAKKFNLTPKSSIKAVKESLARLKMKNKLSIQGETA